MKGICKEGRASTRGFALAAALVALVCALAIALPAALAPAQAWAADDDIASGTSGTCDWVIDADGVLTISPSDGEEGYLATMGSTSKVPWYSYADQVTAIVIEDGAHAGVNAAYMFRGVSNATSFGGDGAAQFVTSKTTSISSMFYGCSSIVSIDVSQWDVSNVETMNFTFRDCTSLTSLEVSAWDTSSVTSLQGLFYNCTSLASLDVSGWVTSNVTSLSTTFYKCSSLTELDLSEWNTAKVTTLYDIFYMCSSLESLDLSGWDTSNVTSSTVFMYVFDGCDSLSKIVLGSGWDCWSSETSTTRLGCLPTPDTELGTWVSYDCDSSVAGTTYTAAALAAAWDGETYAGTWVWATSLSVSASASSEADPVTPGDAVSWTIEVSSADDAVTLYDVVVSLALPDGSGEASVASSSAEGYESELADGALTISLDELAAGETWTIVVSAGAPDVEGEETVSATASGSSANTAEATAAASIDVTTTYTIVYDLNYDCDESEYASVEAAYGDTVTAAADPARNCYAFGGWNTAADGSGTAYEAGASLSALSAEDGTTVTLYAQWELSGHTEGDAVVENSVEATCTADGSYESVVYCSVCGEELSRETVTVEATGHSYGEGVVTTAATCTEDGVMTYTCTVCNGELEGGSYTEAIAAIGHDWDYGNITWTWSEDYGSATATVTCSACGETLDVEAEVASATNDDGSTTYTATIADDDGNAYTDSVTVEAAEEEEEGESGDTDGESDGSDDGSDGESGDTDGEGDSDDGSSLAFIELAGDLRYDTMAEIVAQAYEGAGSEYAVLATGENFPDALTASSLAGALGCPIVLVADYDAAIEAAAEAIEAVGATKIYVVGGTSAVSDEAVEAVLEATGAELVERLYGDTRQETALAIAEETLELTEADSTVAVVSTGENFPDVLSISAYSYWACAPIYLTELDGTLSEETLSAIEEAGYEQVIIIGGNAVVSDEAEADLEELLGEGNVERLYGDDRYETCEAVVAWCLAQGMSYDGCAVATGENFPDALAGSVLCGCEGSVILLASDDSVACADGLASNAGAISAVYFLGGDAAVTQDARDAVADAFGVEYDDVVVVVE